MATYEELMAKARELAASGQTDAAKRVAQIAVNQRGGGAVASTLETAQPALNDTQRQMFGIGDGPQSAGLNGEGFILDPNTGAMTSQELQANRMRPSALEAARIGSEEGFTWGGRDELSGGIAAATPLMPGTAGEQYDMAQLRARAELEAARRDHPVAATVGEIGGSLVTGGAAGRGLRAGAQAVAPGASQALGRMAGRNVATRAGTGAAAGAVGAGGYGFNAGEGGLEGRAMDAANAAKWGAGFGAGASLLSDAALAAYVANAERKATNALVSGTPSAKDLKKTAKGMYEDAIASGKDATPDQTKALAQDMRAMLLDEGVIGPRNGLGGNALSVEGFPKVSNLMARVDDYFGQSMTPAQMRTLRRTAQRAAGSTDPQEARLGAELLRKVDDWVQPNMPGIAEANSVYAAAKRGDLMDKTMRKTARRAGQFSGSGYENALRTDFRQLLGKIEDGKIKGVTPEQIAALERVAIGGPVENAARWAGKAAPTSIVNIGMGGGMPFLVGNALGGPGIGAAAGATAMGLGAAGRKAATAMQSKNAAIASALMRGGKKPSVPGISADKRRLIAEMLRNSMVPATQ